MRKRTKQTEHTLYEGQPEKKVTSATSSYRGKNKKSTTGQIADEIALLDKLLQGFGIRNDAQLASWLGIDKSLIYATRAGKRRLGLMQRLKILDHIGFLKARSILESILPENLARELVAFNKQIVAEQIRQASSYNANDPNVTLLEATKVAFGYTTDAALADFLGVEHNTLATIRAGKSGLGPKPRLIILERLTNAFDAEALVQTLESSRKLVRLLDQSMKRQRESGNHTTV